MAKCKNAATATETTPISVIVHPPERRRQRLMFVASGCCCSCCCSCCCLHSLGSLVGASVVGVVGAVNSASTETHAARLLGQGIYWLATAILCALTLVMPMVTGNGGFAVGVIILVLAMPLIQTVGAVVAALIIVVAPIQHKSASLGQVGKLTMGMLGGTFVGALLLGLAGVGLIMLFKR